MHRDLASRVRGLGAGILGRGRVDARDREIMVQRTCARCGAEWGVHAVAFGNSVGLSDGQIAATADRAADDSVWSPRDALLIALADELHDSCNLPDGLWSALAEHYSDEQLLELVVTAGWYRPISYVINGIRVASSRGAARFPIC